MISLTAGENESGARLDACIGSASEELSRSYAAKLIEDGAVYVNGEPVTSKKHKVSAGDVIEIDMPEPEVLDVTPEDIPLDIVYEDDDVIVVNKPAGMVVHPGNGNYSGTLVNAIMYHCGDSLSTINGVVRPGIVHRIDKDTSGLIMIAKNDKAHESLAAQLQVHSVTREYTALVYDNIKEDELTIDKPIGRDVKNRLRRAVLNVPDASLSEDSTARNAVTHVKVQGRYSLGGSKYTLITARLETGRTHQIRVHMAYIKHPLVGDPLYGPAKALSKLCGVPLTGQLLHAGTLGFNHPSTGEYMEFHADLPENFTSILQGLTRK